MFVLCKANTGEDGSSQIVQAERLDSSMRNQFNEFFQRMTGVLPALKSTIAQDANMERHVADGKGQ